MLSAKPLPGAGSWGQQFRHIGRVRENYLRATRTGVAEFSPDGCGYPGVPAKQSLVEYLDRTLAAFHGGLQSEREAVDWFGESWPLVRHINALVLHETLHHGQLILYARASGLKLPRSWDVWGE